MEQAEIKISLQKANNVAKRFLALIEPHVLKAEVVGAIRRQCQKVGIIEIICVENTHRPLSELFSDGYPGMIVNGARLKRFQYPNDNIKIELYIVSGSDYGRMVAIRTGSSCYSVIKLSNIWWKLGWTVTELGLRRRSECIKKGSKWLLKEDFKHHPTLPVSFETEADFYIFLGIEWIKPSDRNWNCNNNKLNYTK